MDGPAPEAPAADPAWERRHPGVPECWSFDFTVPDGSLAGFVALTLWPGRRPAWYWAALVGRRRPYLLVRDVELEPPRAPTSREIRGEGIWADVNCETPHDHWSLGLEAFGVALEDPDEALGDERGDRTGLGLDLEWEAVAQVAGGAGDYAQACAVHGEVLVGGGGAVETIALDGRGWRRHAWGPPADWSSPRSWLAGFLDDGTPHTSVGDAAPAAVTAVLHRAPLRLGPARAGPALERALCRFDAGTGPGLGWRERVAVTPPAGSAGRRA